MAGRSEGVETPTGSSSSKCLRGYRELILENHIKITLVDLTTEFLVSADVELLPWCFDVCSELRIEDSKLIYGVEHIPEIGDVELVGYKVMDEFKVINIKFKINRVDEIVDVYRKIINYLSRRCIK